MLPLAAVIILVPDLVLGALLPLAVGYITVCGLEPAGLLVMMGLSNVATGLAYRLPMPLEPMEVLAVMAIAEAWIPEKVYAAVFARGAVGLLMGVTGAMTTPKTVVMLMVGVEFFKFARKLRFNKNLLPVGATVTGSVMGNMAVGFATGRILHYLVLGRPEETDEPD